MLLRLQGRGGSKLLWNLTQTRTWPCTDSYLHLITQKWHHLHWKEDCVCNTCLKKGRMLSPWKLPSNFPHNCVCDTCPQKGRTLSLQKLQSNFPHDCTCDTCLQKGRMLSPQNYGLISLRSVVCKVMEPTVVSRIMQYAEDNNMIVPEQYGFRNGCLFKMQLLGLADKLTKDSSQVSEQTLGRWISRR